MTEVPNGSVFVPIWVAIIMVVPGILSAILGFLNNVLAQRAKEHAVQTTDKINELEKSTNGKLESLLKVTGESEHAKGVLEGKKER